MFTCMYKFFHHNHQFPVTKLTSRYRVYSCKFHVSTMPHSSKTPSSTTHSWMCVLIIFLRVINNNCMLARNICYIIIVCANFINWAVVVCKILFSLILCRNYERDFIKICCSNSSCTPLEYLTYDIRFNKFLWIV